MPKFRIKYNYGYGDQFEVIEATDLQEAEQYAYEAWKDAAESNAIYLASPVSDDTELG